MAQIVGYFQDDPVYIEGPFVMVQAGTWRLEVEVKGHFCPSFPHHSVVRLLLSHQMVPDRTHDKQAMAKVVDWLNGQVRIGMIVLEEGQWVWPGPEYQPVLRPSDFTERPTVELSERRDTLEDLDAIRRHLLDAL